MITRKPLSFSVTPNCLLLIVCSFPSVNCLTCVFDCPLDLTVGHIEFLPVVLLQLVNPNGSLSGVYNVERYMAGEFIKLTNNFQFAIDRGVVSDLVLAFSHFTYQASNGQLIIVDIQGWTPASNEIGCTFLTDPQIHSVVYNCFGTGNLSQKGIDSFWKNMHPQCNDLCKKMQLFRPDAHKSQ